VEVTHPSGSRRYGFSGGSSRSAKVCHGEVGVVVKRQQSVSDPTKGWRRDGSRLFGVIAFYDFAWGATHQVAGSAGSEQMPAGPTQPRAEAVSSLA
jgi:hypothetical protein